MSSLTLTQESAAFGGRHLELSLDGHWAFLLLPPDTPAKKIAGWVWYAPTFSGLPPSWRRLPDQSHRHIVAHLLARRFALAGIDVGESHGNPAGRELFTRFHAGLTAQFGLPRQTVLLPQSRGGLMHYNWAVEHPDLVTRIGGIYTVCDLRSFPGLAKAAAAYGMSEPEMLARLAEYNPIERLGPLAAAQVPLFNIHGDRDTLVPLEANAGELSRRYRALGGPRELLVIPGAGHEEIDAFFDNQRLMEFLTNSG